MANYVIGDIHGCFSVFEQLLQKIEFNQGKDTLLLTGDLINRGPQSVEVLKWVMQHEACVRTVLGNHELYLLALSEGCKPPSNKTLLKAIFGDQDKQRLLNWLRHQPLLLTESSYIIVHAGLLPKWSLKKAQQYALEIEKALQSTRYHDFLIALYQQPSKNSLKNLDKIRHLRKIIDVMTRMRCLTHDGNLDFSYQGTLEDMPSRLMPWFSLPTVRCANETVAFGHWSALEPFVGRQVIATDGGCVWGKKLVAVCLENKTMHTLESVIPLADKNCESDF